MSLRRRLFLWSVTVGVLSVTVIGLVVTLTLVRVFRQDMAEQQLAQARVLAQQVRGAMNVVADELRMLGGQCVQDVAHSEELARHLVRSGAGYWALVVIDPDGDEVVRLSRWPEDALSPAEAALLQEAELPAGAYRVGRHEVVDGRHLLPIAVPFAGGEVRALLHVPELHLSREVLAASGQSDATYVMDRTGRVVAHSDLALVERVGLNPEIPVSLDSGQRSSLRGLSGMGLEATGTYQLQSRYWRFAAAPVPGMPWVAFTRINAGSLPVRITPMVGPVLAALVGLTLFTLIGWALQVRWLMRQFDQIAAMARSLADGRLTVQTPATQAQEFKTLSHSLDQMRQKLVSHRFETLRAIMRALEARDDYTLGHSERVMWYAVAIGQAMGLDPETVEDLRVGAILHDVGKIALDRSLLNKPGPLNEPEWQAIRQHPVVGAEILESASALHSALPLVRWHHERLDGSGYPDGLRGDEVPLPVRILAVADTFDAMTTNRPYRGPLPVAEALAQIRSRTPQEYDPEVVTCLERLVREQPGRFPLAAVEAAV